MNIDFEKIPPVIFDWMETQSFAQLGHAQQKEVLSYFSDAEYDEMHQACKELRSVSPLSAVEKHAQKKEQLLDHFDRHYGLAEDTHAYRKRLFVWQAAAIFLMMLAGGLFYKAFGLKKDVNFQEMATADTVYVNKEMAPEIIHDTVYRYKSPETTQEREREQTESFLDTEEIEPMDDLEALPLMEFENLGNTPKGNSMQDDSLLRKFGFVAM